MKRILSYIIVGIICIGIGVGASSLFDAKDVKYSNSKTSVTNVSDALDEFTEYQELYKEYYDKYNTLYDNFTTLSNNYNTLNNASVTLEFLGFGNGESDVKQRSSMYFNYFKDKYNYLTVTNVYCNGSSSYKMNFTKDYNTFTDVTLNTKYALSNIQELFLYTSYTYCYATVVLSK